MASILDSAKLHMSRQGSLWKLIIFVYLPFGILQRSGALLL